MASFIRVRNENGQVVEIPIAKVGKSAYEIALKHGFEGTEEEWAESLKGLPGKTGNGIARIEKTYVSGLVDTYTITFTDNTTATFTVTNGEDGDDGVGIKSIVQTTTSSADGGENVITVTLTNGSTSTFKVKNGSKGNKGDTGNGIKAIAKTSTSGLVDTYTITFTDNTTATFTITNGQDGSNGERGGKWWTVTTTPGEYTTTVNGLTPSYRIALSTALSQSGATEILVGDIVKRSYYIYSVIYVDSSYVYLGARVSIRGSSGTSVTVSKVTESAASGGENVVEFSDGNKLTVMNGKSGYTPVKGVDYDDGDDGTSPHIGDNGNWWVGNTDTGANAARIDWQHVDTVGECTDESVLYILPDGTVYLYGKVIIVGGLPEFENLADTDSGDWLTDMKMGSGGTPEAATGVETTNYIPFTWNSDNVIRIRGIDCSTTGDQLYYSCRIAFYNANKEIIQASQKNALYVGSAYEPEGGILDRIICTLINDGKDYEMVIPPAEVEKNTAVKKSNLASAAYFRISGKPMPASDGWVITVGEEITYTEDGEEYKFHEANFKLPNCTCAEDVANLKAATKTLQSDVSKLKAGTSNVENIRTWDKPVYDAAPVTLLGDDRNKPALTSADYSVEAVYAKYDALMAAHPKYITTPITFGQSAVNLTNAPNYTGHELRCYEFREPDGVLEPNGVTYEMKPKIIMMSGVHTEFAGVYGLYYALEEIATNPEFDDIRRNAHIIVIPCANPFCLSSQTVEGWTTSHVNANGVAIHNNFGVDHSTSGTVGAFNYGGASPYSEPETIFIDNIVKAHKDAIAFISCHNYDYDTYYGTRVIWGSSATAHMCNLVTRLADKMSKAWLRDDRYKTTLPSTIESNWKGDADNVDYRLGYAQMSTSAGTEQKNAIQYNMQSTNLEIARLMKVFSGSTSCSSAVMTRGAEVYANWIRTILAAYDYRDKKDHAFIE